MASSRFEDLALSEEEFIDEQENENTKKKTRQNVALLEQFTSAFVAAKNTETCVVAT